VINKPIHAIWCPDQGEYTVGTDDVTKIEVTEEHGDLGPIDWFLVYVDGEPKYHLNSKHVEGVNYDTD